MKNSQNNSRRQVDRRSFMRNGLLAGGAAAVGAGLIAHASEIPFQGRRSEGPLTPGDVAILRFLAAAELIEADLWTQYAELGGIGDNQPIEVDPNETLNPYQAALSNLDSDGPQYITSNTLDEVSHATFLNAYLESRGADPVNFDEFRTLKGSTAMGSTGIGRLTNLMHLNVDTSWFIRYRSATNPDFGATFPQAITLNGVTAIPVNDADLNNPNPNHLQAIANTAAFHFGYIEQGGSSLYAAMSQKVTDPEVLQITLGIGGDEIAHFLEWVDFAGNGVQPTVAPFTDPVSGLTFPNFFSPLNPLKQPSLIFPVPCEFISPNLPHVSIIRPLTDKFGGAVATIASFTADGLFVGQSHEFLNLLQIMALEADAATRILF
jgi:Ferritin-like domain